MYSLIIKNATVIDGTGGEPREADVAVAGDRIVAIAPNLKTGARTVVDGTGKILAPGFIDIQNHSDSHWQLFDNPVLDSMVAQGITTIVVGNSGASLAPLVSEEALLSLQKWHSLDGSNIDWQSFSEFAARMSYSGYGCNVLSLVGYSTVRRGLVGDRLTPLTAGELASIKDQVQKSLDAGAFGVSIGLTYAHELVISEAELVEIAQVVARSKALLSVHLRDEGQNITDSVREITSIAQQAEANVKIAHMKIRGSDNDKFTTEVLDELEAAWHKGTNIHFDVYPYTSTWQALYSYLPKNIIRGGRKRLLEELKDKAGRQNIISQLSERGSKISNFIIASTTANLHVNGKTVGSIAASMGVSSEEAVLQIIENGGSEVLVFDDSLDEHAMKAFSHHALGFIGSNGSGYDTGHREKLVHPRCFGTMPAFLREVLDSRGVSLQEAVRKITSGPAKKLGLAGRGVIAVDAIADLVLFDPLTIRSNATLNNPYQYPEGISDVWVGGQPTVQRGRLMKAKPGTFLRRI